MAKHAKLSPSSSDRWMNCAGSPALIGDEQSVAGPAAMLGTAGHKVIEVCLQKGVWNAGRFAKHQVLVYGPGDEETLILKPGQALPKYATEQDSGWRMFVVDSTLQSGVQMMLDEVARVRGEMFEPKLYTERFLDMSWLDPDLGGTADVTLIDAFVEDHIHLFDYKNGRIIVEVIDNTQMRQYCVGLLHEHPSAKRITVHIIQPNAMHEDGCIRSVTYEADEIKLFEIRMKQAADATRNPKAPRTPGAHCQWCPAKIRCPEHSKMIKDAVMIDLESLMEPEMPPVPTLVDGTVSLDGPTVMGLYDDPERYRDALAHKAKWIPFLDQWSRDLRKAITAELMNGKPVGDYKLVRGRANRKWIGSGDNFLKQLAAATEIQKELLLTDPELKSPAQVEKMGAGPEHRKTVLAAVKEYAVKPPGKVTLADGNDPHAAIDASDIASDAFSELFDGEEEDAF